jgi:hypothetical protein
LLGRRHSDSASKTTRQQSSLAVTSRPDRFRTIVELLGSPLVRKFVCERAYLAEVHCWYIEDGYPRVETTVLGPEDYDAPLPAHLVKPTHTA